MNRLELEISHQEHIPTRSFEDIVMMQSPLDEVEFTIMLILQICKPETVGMMMRRRRRRRRRMRRRRRRTRRRMTMTTTTMMTTTMIVYRWINSR